MTILSHRLQRILKPRFLIIYPITLYLILFTCSDDRSIMQGIWLILAGIFVRMWANGYAIKMDKLTTSGPYAHMRHPLYLGSILIFSGFVVMLKLGVVGALFFTIFFAMYWRTLRREEEMLIAKFSQRYLNYREVVPAFLPKLDSYKNEEKWPFDLDRLLQSQEYKIAIWMIILVIAFHLKDELLHEREALDVKILSLFIAAIALGSCDFILDIFRKKTKYAVAM